MMHPILILLLSILLFLVFAGFGRRLLALLRVQTITPAESCAFGAALGLGVVAYLVLVIGLLGLLNLWVLLVLVTAIAVLSLREAGRMTGEILTALFSRAAHRLNPSGSLVAVGIVSLGALALIQALAPPSILDWDGLSNHLAVPKIHLDRGAIFHIDFIHQSNSPALMEMLYALGLSLGGVVLAKLFHFWMLAASAVAVYALCRRHFAPVVGSIGAVIYISVPVVHWQAGVASNHLATALYITLAVYALLNWHQTRDAPWLLVSGIMSGFALGTQMLAMIPFAVLCLWTLTSFGSSQEWSRGLRAATLIGLTGLLIGSPWYVKSYLSTGNPVYPFMYEVFGGAGWSQAGADALSAMRPALGMGRGVPELILLPWNLTMSGFKFIDTTGLFGLIGAAFVGLLPVHIMSCKSARGVILLWTLSLFSILGWFVVFQHTAHLVGVIPLLSILAALGVYYANREWLVARHVVNAFVVLCVTFSLITSIVISQDVVSAAIGIESHDDYLHRTLEVYDAQRFINERLPEDARIVLLHEDRGFYLDREYVRSDLFPQDTMIWPGIESGAEMGRHFAEEGYTHALVNWRFAGDDLLMRTLIGHCLAKGMIQEVFSSYGVSVYELAPE